jgi:3-hydroxyisobutyrate dehydrogenase-like beta-hydroxyacid dehydrogenase
MRIGFVGLGQMGLPMARNLRDAGHELVVFNRSREKAEALAKDGARIAGSSAEAARDAEVVFSMLADDRAVEDVAFGDDGLIRGLSRGAVHVSSSTISVALADRLTEAHRAAGQELVCAPVFGRPPAAAAKQLWIVTAGASAAVARCRPLFEAIARGVSVVGERPSAANLVKLSGNFLIASMIEALAEAFALTRKAGVEPKAFLEVFQSALARGPVLEAYGGLIAEQKYSPPGFRLALGLKDIELVLQSAKAEQVPMPFARVLEDHFLGGLAQGMADLDWSALGKLAAERAGLDRG